MIEDIRRMDPLTLGEVVLDRPAMVCSEHVWVKFPAAHGRIAAREVFCQIQRYFRRITEGDWKFFKPSAIPPVAFKQVRL